MILGQEGQMDLECLTEVFVKYSERPAEDGCLLVPPSGGVAGRTKSE